MPLMLPFPVWHVRFHRRGWAPSGDAPELGPTCERRDCHLFDENEPERCYEGGFDPALFDGDPRVKEVGRAWYFTDDDLWHAAPDAELPRRPRGRLIESPMGRALLYTDRETALEEVAAVCPPTALVLRLSREAPEPLRRLARAVLDTDDNGRDTIQALGVLADALEEAGHADASAVRALHEAGPTRPETADDATDGDPTALTVETGPAVEAVAVTPDGRLLAAASWDRTVRVWRADAGARLHFWMLKQKATALAASPDGRRLAVGDGSGGLAVRDLETGAEAWSVRTRRQGVLDVAWSPAGAVLATTDGANSVSFWDVATGEKVRRWPGHEGGVTGLAFSPVGNLLATAGADDAVRLRNLTTAAETAVLAAEGAAPRRVVWSADGRRLAATGDGRPVVLVWEVPAGGRGATARPLRRLEGGSGLGVALSPDGRLVAASDDEGALVWEATTGRLLRHFKAGGSSTRPLAFTPDGRRLLAGCSDGSARLWDVSGLA
jgi:DNA-binding beta-propeller fold protein YncE